MAGSHHISRRDFIKLVTFGAGGVIVAGIGIPAVDYLIAPALRSDTADVWIPLGKVENFEIGKPTLATFVRSKTNGWEKTVTTYGVFVLKKSDTEFFVVSNKCTHLVCHVNWNADKQEYVCPCHDAQFDINGKVLGGPPPRPLDAYAGDQLMIEDGVLKLHFVEG